MYSVMSIFTGGGSTDKNIRWEIRGNFISHMESYYELSVVDEHKVIRELHHEFKNKNTQSKKYLVKLISE